MFASIMQNTTLISAIGLILTIIWLVVIIRGAIKKKLIGALVLITAASFAIVFGGIWLIQSIPILKRLNSHVIPIITLLAFYIGIAVAGYITTRFLKLKWPEPLWAFLPVATAASIYSIRSQFIGQDPFYLIYIIDMLRWGAAYVVLLCAGLFWLPLLFHDVRKGLYGYAPSRSYLGGIMLVLMLIVVEYARSFFMPGYFGPFGLLPIFVAAIIAVIAVAVGILLIIIDKVAAGTAWGSTGTVTMLATLIAWFLLGSPWFP